MTQTVPPAELLPNTYSQPYKVCLLAAGRGSRLSTWQTIHKALMPVGDQAVISRIINYFPPEVEIVVALGYLGEQVRDFLGIAHPDRNIQFVDVPSWDQPGSGPGKSLLACQAQLQCPFIFTGVDTLVKETIPAPTYNWIGVAAVDEPESYLLAEVKAHLVRRFYDKSSRDKLALANVNTESILRHAFIGLAGVHSWEKFWRSLQINQHKLTHKELQVTVGLEGLLADDLTVRHFTWQDTGTDQHYAQANQLFQPTVAPKPNEQLYIQNGQVIKFFSDPTIVKQRVGRAQQLRHVCPPITKSNNQFYSYPYQPGQLISNVTDETIFKKFLLFCQQELWQPVTLDTEEQQQFQTACQKMYFDKTRQRIHDLQTKLKITDGSRVINGVKVAPIAHMLADIDWPSIHDGQAVIFHGDLQPENIIVTPDNQFMLIDWRQDFGGLTHTGDLYYDLAKLDHALLINGDVIRKNLYSIDVENDNIQLEFNIRSHLLNFRSLLHDYLLSQKLDLKKVRLLSYLTFLNIAPLHHSPYNLFLYYLGQYLIDDELRNN